MSVKRPAGEYHLLDTNYRDSIVNLIILTTKYLDQHKKLMQRRKEQDSR